MGTSTVERAYFRAPLLGAQLRDASVGIVTATITVANRRDEILAEEGIIAPERVRTITLEHVLVDTGATTLCLPSDVIQFLGLSLHRPVNLETASGTSTMGLYREAHLTVFDRDGTFDCIELPGGSEPLLGVVPMELLGLEPDLKNRVLRALPMDETGSYLLAYKSGQVCLTEEK